MGRPKGSKNKNKTPVKNENSAEKTNEEFEKLSAKVSENATSTPLTKSSPRKIKRDSSPVKEDNIIRKRDKENGENGTEEHANELGMFVFSNFQICSYDILNCSLDYVKHYKKVIRSNFFGGLFNFLRKFLFL